MTMVFKDLAASDIDRAVEFACVGMHFEKYIGSKFGQRLYGRYFLYDELRKATQVIALYDDRNLVGLLLANMKDEPKAYQSFGHRLFMAVLGPIMRAGDKTYLEANEKMLAAYCGNADPDGELSFLATDPTAQGKGIGTRMLDELARREAGKLIYLYTDSNCTYQFYEHRGFVREAEVDAPMNISGVKDVLPCYLYTRRFDAVRAAMD